MHSTGHLRDLATKQSIAVQKRLSEIEEKRVLLTKHQTDARVALENTQKQRFHAENLLRQERFNNGWRGIFDRITGKTRRVRKQNELEAVKAAKRDQKEQDSLIFEQMDQRQLLQIRIERLDSFNLKRKDTIEHDIQQYRDIAEKRKEQFEHEPRDIEHER